MRIISFLLLSTAAFGACTKEIAPGTALVVTDSLGTVIVDHGSTVGADIAAWIVDSAPSCEIGGPDSSDGYNLFRVTNVSRLSNGHLVVVNSGTLQILVFDGSGRYLRSMGRRGSGPGEFNVLSLAQVMRGDSIAAYDARLARVTVFDESGNVGRTENIGPYGGYLRHFFPDGAALGKISNSESIAGVQRPLITLTCVMCTEDAVDTVARVLERELYMPPQKGYMIDRPLGMPLATAVSDSLVYVGNGDRYEFRVFRRTGSLVRILRADNTPVRISRSLMEEFTASRLEGLRPGRYRDDVAMWPNTAGVFPEFLPAHGSIQIGIENELWVEEYKTNPDDKSHWLVFDSDGALTARVETPERFVLMSVGADWIGGVWKGDMDVQHVRLYGLRRL